MVRGRLPLFFALVVATGPVARAENLGIGRPCTWTRTPNYARCTDAGDALQLTDGTRVRGGHIWLERGCVGWEGSPGDVVGIVIDLGRSCRVDSIVVHTAWFPPSGVLSPAILVGAGDTPDRFENAGAHPAPAFDVDVRGPRRVALAVPVSNARGRYVLVALLHQGNYCFTDEIEVHGEPAGVATPPTAADASRAATSAPSFALADLGRAAAVQRRSWAMSSALKDFHGATEADRFAARAAAWRAAGRPALSVQRVDPWAATTPWSDLQPAVAETLALWPGAWSAAAFEIANATSDSMRIVVRTLTPDPEAPLLVAREVLYVEAHDGHWSGDALPLAAHKVALASGQVRQIWFDVDARAAAPGFYQLPFRIAERSFTLPVRVHAVRADSTSLAAHNWTYPEKYALTRTDPEAAIADNRAHGIDSWCLPADAVPWPDLASIAADGHLQRAPDFTACDRALTLHDAAQARRLFFFWHFDATRDDPSRGRFRHHYGSAPWRRAVSEWLGLWMKHLAARGIDTTRVYMQPFDETTTPPVRRCFAMLHAMQPRVRLALTVTRTSTPASLRALDPYLDLAILEREALPTFDGWTVNAMHRGREVWVYDVMEPAKSVAPNAYRALVWEAWARGLSGVAFWAYCDDGEQSADVWNDFDGTRTDFNVVYGRVGAPIALREVFTPSKRWQAFRIGRCETALLEHGAGRTALRAQDLVAFASGTFDPHPILRRALDTR